MVHREETSWTICIEAAAEFEPDYDGELDGYVWRDTLFRTLQNRALTALLRELATAPGWKVRPGNRGLPATDEVLLYVTLDPAAEPPAT